MQTYLNAFIVSDFTNISNAATKRPDELLQRVFGQPATIARGEADFALEVGVKFLQAMEDYFDYPYILPKMDQIGIPTFYFGAMENWGLVTYRESALYSRFSR
jgi:aminopeptidase N